MNCEHLPNPINGRDLFYFWPDGTEAGFLCEYCAVEQGFCSGCGSYIAGIDAETHYMQLYGVCSNCVSELDEDGELDEETD